MKIHLRSLNSEIVFKLIYVYLEEICIEPNGLQMNSKICRIVLIISFLIIYLDTVVT